MRLASLLFVMVALFACGHDGVGQNGDVVGGPCAANGDCEFRCELGGDYPQGTCSKPCSTDNDCPDGTWCVDREGGICLLACDRPSDCRGGYNCEGVRNHGHGGDSLVCTN